METYQIQERDVSTNSLHRVHHYRMATRVSGDPLSGNNGLFYFHSDHLGSATFLTYGNGHANEGLKKANTTNFFTPFGEYRIDAPDPTDDITDHSLQTTFTGHKHN